jgi:predicted nucleic acid-binding protein
MILQRDRAIVPSLWVLETANGLVMAGRRGQLTSHDIEIACRQLEAMLSQSIEVFTEWSGPREAIRSGGAHQLSVYDGLYLELARRERLSLATSARIFTQPPRPQASNSSSRDFVHQRCSLVSVKAGTQPGRGIDR